MRQLILKADTGHQDRVLRAVDKFQGKNTITVPVQDHDVFIIFLPNHAVNDFLQELQDLDQLEINLIPRGVITLYPPESEAPDRVADVQPKSSLEIYLGGIQSVGSMFGLLGYAVAAGIIVWIGLYTTTSYLLVAAMLIAPFAGPAMNAALATAAGKWSLLKSSLMRYGIATGMGIVASFLLTVIFPLQTLTPLMIEVSQVSSVAVLLPVISGFAGAINICQSERDSLVSGAAVGILVAASLAPPVGLLGAGLYMMDWQIVLSSLFRIILQLFGIHFSATLVFYFYGKITTDGVRFLKGRRIVRTVTGGMVCLGLAALMYWQFSHPPFLRKASLNTELTEAMYRELNSIDYIHVLDKDVSFTNTQYRGMPVVNFQALVLPKDTSMSRAEVKREIIDRLKANVRFPKLNIYRVYEINVVED